MKNQKNPDYVFPNDGPEYDPEQELDLEPSEAELEYLRGLTRTPRPKRRYGDEDQDDLMDLIDRPED